MIDRSRALTYVLRQEASVSLGSAGRKLRVALERLECFDRTGRSDPAWRAQLLRNAAYHLGAYVIQREALGLRDHAGVDAEFGVTREVWNAVGVL